MKRLFRQLHQNPIHRHLSSGIRIIDSGHTIINNYMESLNGESWNAALSWLGGSKPSGGTSSDYQEVDNVLVAFNTIYDCAVSVYMNNAKGSRGPTHSTMANNLVHSTRGTLITGSLSIAGIDFDDNNILSGSDIGQTISAITTDPVMTLGGDAVYSPSETGSAANAAEGSYVPVAQDVLGRTRPTAAADKDIGAEEVSGGTAPAEFFQPLTNDDLGSKVGASYTRSVLGLPSSFAETVVNISANPEPTLTFDSAPGRMALG